MKNLFKKLDEPLFAKRLHASLAVIWFVAAFPIMIWFRQSIALLVFISVYAIVASHWSAWDAAGGELEIDKIKSKIKST